MIRNRISLMNISCSALDKEYAAGFKPAAYLHIQDSCGQRWNSPSEITLQLHFFFSICISLLYAENASCEILLTRIHARTAIQSELEGTVTNSIDAKEREYHMRYILSLLENIGLLFIALLRTFSSTPPRPQHLPWVWHCRWRLVNHQPACGR